MTVQVQDHKTRPIQLQRGVRQGDVISPKLFTNVLEDVFKTLDWKGHGICINGEYMSHLRFADDIVIMAESLQVLSWMLSGLNAASRRVGLGMNFDKTKVMYNAHIKPEPVAVGEATIEVVQTIRLGRSNFDKEAARRIQLGWAAFGKLRDIFFSAIPQSLKTKVFNQCVLPVMTNKRKEWIGFVTGFRPVHIPLPRRPSPPSPRARPLNVLLVGFDSTSKNGFIRSMPVTFRSLQEDFGAVVMDGYNILGDGTPATLFPLLTGRTELENPDRRTSVSVKESVDDLPFIFKRVRSHGYRTVYFEDHPNVGTFNFRFTGFRRQPADHYLRHFFKLANELNKKNW
ncbi:unnamed protein product [Plutella xylostella]|uniref:(diamondback moth) hypothetical protein n=1 Tax=Plutella xylostella TaxID=51655 RepID=A0A8S4EK88_PLUXY|nr:unnamed protein product [Plutella xylostella]